MRALVTALLLAPFAAGVAHCQQAEATCHRVLVGCESSDEVYRIAFDGRDAKIERVLEVGYQPTEIEGPHGLTTSRDGRHWYLSIAHGKPFGLLYKYRTDTDELVGECELGMFPATMQISPATGLLYVVNFNLHGRMLPSTVSIVDPEAMVEVARTVTGAMPHGSRLSPDGLRHYSCAMMSGELYEIDATSFAVTRTLQLDTDRPKNHASEAKPTWVSPHPRLPLVYAALNGKDTIVEVDTDSFSVRRRIATGKAPYNLDLTPDGSTLVATCKGEGAIAVIDTKTGNERARLKSSRAVTHGVICTPDGRYAFVTAEGRGSERGTVDVVDLSAMRLVATVAVGLQAGGIAYLPAAGG